MSQHMSTDELIKLLKPGDETPVWPFQNVVYNCLKRQQENIKEQKEMIESLWSWAENKKKSRKKMSFKIHRCLY